MDAAETVVRIEGLVKVISKLDLTNSAGAIVLRRSGTIMDPPEALPLGGLAHSPGAKV